MRVYISVDMEGASGVTRWEDVVTRGQDYQRARSWMTADVNAAIAGARRAGATEFVVEENHGIEMLCNLQMDEIDPAADVIRGLPRNHQATTMAGLDASFDAVFLVAHHARVRSRVGICAHTISYTEYRDVRLDGQSVGEGEIFALAAAQHGVPTALVTGDDVVAAEMSARCPTIEAAVVKRALANTAGVIIPPARAHSIIEHAAARAIERVRDGAIAAPEVQAPFAFEVELLKPLSQDALAAFDERFPEMRVVDERTISWEHDDMTVCFRRAAIVGHIANTPGAVRRY